ncbi:MAG TPA: hypothetical protein VNO17_01605 [Actinomycetota bacterium]|nr:hypothetical protein [Actinomycetota bacterium]
MGAPSEQEILEAAFEMVHDWAETIRARGGAVRWVVAEAEDEEGPPTRILLETPRVPLWLLAMGDLAPRIAYPRCAPRWVVEERGPDLLAEWERSERFFLAAFNGTPGDRRSRTYVDCVTTEVALAEMFHGLYRNGLAPLVLRTRTRMLEEALDLRQALRFWEQGDDRVLDETQLAWAGVILGKVPRRAAGRARLRWAPT